MTSGVGFPPVEFGNGTLSETALSILNRILVILFGATAITPVSVRVVKVHRRWVVAQGAIAWGVKWGAGKLQQEANAKHVSLPEEGGTGTAEDENGPKQ